MMHRVLAAPLALFTAAAAASAQSDTELAALEAAFAEQMSGCRMVGHFTVDGRDGPPRAESYTIEQAKKLRDEKWQFDATIEYDDKKVTLPIGVEVLWAGDTPTIQVTKLGIPMLGTYSARVVIYGDRYAGLWSGKNYGGHMFGTIVHAAPEPGDGGADGAADGDWPTWRGPNGTGEAPGATPPVTWSESENIRWKAALPGLGNSTPIVLGNRIFLTTAVETELEGEPVVLPPLPGRDDRGDRGGRRRREPPPPLTRVFDFRVLALDRSDGSVVWSRSVKQAVPHERGHNTGSQASASPVTDGERIYAHFGSRGIHCLDLEGEVLWSKDFGYMRTRNEFGEGSSPAVWGDTVVINWDHEGDSFICALDKRTGEELWRQPRDEVTSWSSPVIVEIGGRPQVVINATGRSRGYDLRDGSVIWSTGGMTVNTIPTPIVRDGIAWLMSGFRGAELQAIDLVGAEGDLDGSEKVLWRHTRSTSYVPSALLHGQRLWFLRGNNAVLTCLNAGTGEVIYEGQRVPGLRTVYASPVAADGRIYITSREGVTKVITAADTYEELATNELEDTFDASAVMLGDAIYLRGHSSLYCIAER